MWWGSRRNERTLWHLLFHGNFGFVLNYFLWFENWIFCLCDVLMIFLFLIWWFCQCKVMLFVCRVFPWHKGTTQCLKYCSGSMRFSGTKLVWVRSFVQHLWRVNLRVCGSFPNHKMVGRSNLWYCCKKNQIVWSEILEGQYFVDAEEQLLKKSDNLMHLKHHSWMSHSLFYIYYKR